MQKWPPLGRACGLSPENRGAPPAMLALLLLGASSSDGSEVGCCWFVVVTIGHSERARERERERERTGERERVSE